MTRSFSIHRDIGDVSNLLGSFEKWVIDAVASKRSPSYNDVINWFESRDLPLDSLDKAFLKTVHSEGFVSSNYADDEPTRFGIILSTWNNFAKNRGLTQYTESQFLHGGSKGPLSLTEAYDFYRSLAAKVPAVDDEYAMSNLLDIAWAGSAHPVRLKEALRDAGFTVSVGDQWTKTDMSTLNSLKKEVLRALIFSARLDTYMTSGKSYGPLVAKGSLEDKYYLGILRRLINQKFLGPDFDFHLFPKLSARLKALNNQGTGIVFNHDSSWSKHFSDKNWPGTKGVLSNLTQDQRAQILT